jgi:iron complex transport system substrate-binding protein
MTLRRFVFGLLMLAMYPGMSVEKVWGQSLNRLCVKDSMGAQVCVQDTPNRIVSLAPNLTELVFELGGGSSLVGRTSRCNFPDEAKNVPDIGAYMKPDFEKLVAARPDLVLAPKTGIRPELIDRLRRLKIRVYVDDSSNIEDIRKLITNVARLLGTENQAADIVADVQFRQDRINKLVNGEKKTTALFVVGIRPLVVAGSRSFLGSLIREAGGVNIAESVDVEYPKFSIEEVIRTDPDVILILDKECHGEDCFNQWKNHHYLKAVHKNRIHELDADLMSRPGVRTIEGLEKLSTLLHPTVFGTPQISKANRDSAKKQ